jgi:DNA repair protein RadD
MAPTGALVVAHRREIVNQTSAKLTAFDVHHGIIQAGDENKLRPLARVQVASIQTLHARAIRAETMLMPLADLIIIDEAHHACARTYKAVIERYPNAIVLGLTATPCRGDGRGLGGIFTTILQCPQVAELIDAGHLVKSRVYAPVDPDLQGVQTRSGDYVESQLEERMNHDKLVGDIVTHWLKYGSGDAPWPSPAVSVIPSLRARTRRRRYRRLPKVLSRMAVAQPEQQRRCRRAHDGRQTDGWRHNRSRGRASY